MKTRIFKLTIGEETYYVFRNHNLQYFLGNNELNTVRISDSRADHLAFLYMKKNKMKRDGVSVRTFLTQHELPYEEY
jgi:hypothetical protein